MNQYLKKLGKSLLNVLLGVTVGLVVIITSTYVYRENLSEDAMRRKIYTMYDNLWAQTGQSQDKIPLEIRSTPEVNAYNDGSKIVLYTGLIESTKSWDELALVLGHEIAHGNLYHLRMLNEWNVPISDDLVSVLEANADKLGAIYSLKAGYSVCNGREWFKTLAENNGDYQGGNHPGYAYRYNELNINCE